MVGSMPAVPLAEVDCTVDIRIPDARLRGMLRQRTGVRNRLHPRCAVRPYAGDRGSFKEICCGSNETT